MNFLQNTHNTFESYNTTGPFDDDVNETHSVEPLDFYDDEFSLFFDDTFTTASGSQSSSCSSSATSSNSDKISKKNPNNAQACKEFRARRKRQRDKLISRNEELEQDREHFLEKIAQLQNECETLRGQNVQDEQKENELLVAELRQYKRFIQNIMSVVVKTPTITLEEKYRILKTGVDSGIGQVLGLCYTSVQHPNWKNAETITEFENCPIYVRFAYLPYGCTAKTAKRLGFRLDTPNCNYSATVVKEKLKKFFFDAAFKQTMHGKLADIRNKNSGCKVVCEEIIPEELKMIQDTILGEDKEERIQLFKFEETYEDVPEKNIESVYASSYKQVDNIFPKAMKLKDTHVPESEVPSGPCEGYVFMSGTSTVEKAQLVDIQNKNKRSEQTSWYTGQVICPHIDDNNMCDLTFVASLPLEQYGYSEHSTENPIISDDGKLREDFKLDIIMKNRMAFESYRK